MKVVIVMEEEQEMVEEVKVIVFKLIDEEYGVEVNQVRSIERMQSITKVPRTPHFVKGVINLRGIIIPIIDLRKRFDLEVEDYTDNTRIIIVNVGDVQVGLIVDAANDVLDIALNAIEAPPEVVGGIEATYLRGVAKTDDRLLILLNLDKVLSADELKSVRQIETSL